MTNVELINHFVILQTGEIPVNGDLSGVRIELCHQLSIVDTETGEVLGKSQGEGILNLGTPTELEAKYLSFGEWVENIKIVLVTEAMEMIADRKAARETPPTPEIIE